MVVSDVFAEVDARAAAGRGVTRETMQRAADWSDLSAWNTDDGKHEAAQTAAIQVWTAAAYGYGLEPGQDDDVNEYLLIVAYRAWQAAEAAEREE